MERERKLELASAPDILAPYLVRFERTPDAMESLDIFEQCLDDIKGIYTERLDNAKSKFDEVRKMCLMNIPAIALKWILKPIEKKIITFA